MIQDSDITAWVEVRVELRRIEQIIRDFNINDRKPIDSDEGAWGPMLIWCRQNVSGLYNYNFDIDMTDDLVFSFSHKDDATLFKLTWL